jgi:hypothetical protein
MWRTDDPLADFARHDRLEQNAVARLPRCVCCGIRLWPDEQSWHGGEVYCVECFKAEFEAKDE